MRADVLKDLLERVQGCSADDEAKSEFMRMIRLVGAMHGVKSLERDERVAFARHLLDVGCSRPIVRDRLMSQFEVGESTAYRDIDLALQIVPKTAKKWDLTDI